jgi:Ca-activated chloride channel family protein
MFEFGFPWAFALLVLPLLVRWLVPEFRRKNAALAAPFFDRVVALTGEKPGTGSVVSQVGLPQHIVRFVGWALIVTAIASPRFVGEPVLVVKQARDLMIAVDISGSMNRPDFERADGTRSTRLEAVNNVLDDFVSRREGDRLGLMVFGSQAYLQTPFTPDLATVRALLEENEVGMAGPQTAIGNAISLGIRLFEADSADSSVLILLTDGVDTGSSISPFQAARAASELENVVIYTIGIGSTDAPGADLDETTLTEIAEMTGGRYFNASDRLQLESAYETLDQLEPIEYEEASNRPTELLFHWPLGAFLVIALAFQLVSGATIDRHA